VIRSWAGRPPRERWLDIERRRNASGRVRIGTIVNTRVPRPAQAVAFSEGVAGWPHEVGPRASWAAGPMCGRPRGEARGEGPDRQREPRWGQL